MGAITKFMEKRFPKLYKLYKVLDLVETDDKGNLRIVFSNNVILESKGNMLFYSKNGGAIMQYEFLHLCPDVEIPTVKPVMDQNLSLEDTNKLLSNGHNEIMEHNNDKLIELKDKVEHGCCR